MTKSPTTYPLGRIILFTSNVRAIADFYVRAFNLKPIGDIDDPGWVDLDAGACRLSIHKEGMPGSSENGGPWKIVFFAEDVAKARKDVAGRGIEMGPVKKFGELHLCDGSDPDGNRFQISNRP